MSHDQGNRDYNTTRRSTNGAVRRTRDHRQETIPFWYYRSIQPQLSRLYNDNNMENRKKYALTTPNITFPRVMGSLHASNSEWTHLRTWLEHFIVNHTTRDRVLKGDEPGSGLETLVTRDINNASTIIEMPNIKIISVVDQVMNEHPKRRYPLSPMNDEFQFDATPQPHMRYQTGLRRRRGRWRRNGRQQWTFARSSSWRSSGPWQDYQASWLPFDSVQRYGSKDGRENVGFLKNTHDKTGLMSLQMIHGLDNSILEGGNSKHYFIKDGQASEVYDLEQALMHTSKVSVRGKACDVHEINNLADARRLAKLLVPRPTTTEWRPTGGNEKAPRCHGGDGRHRGNIGDRLSWNVYDRIESARLTLDTSTPLPTQDGTTRSHLSYQTYQEPANFTSRNNYGGPVPRHYNLSNIDPNLANSQQFKWMLVHDMLEELMTMFLWANRIQGVDRWLVVKHDDYGKIEDSITGDTGFASQMTLQGGMKELWDRCYDLRKRGIVSRFFIGPGDRYNRNGPDTSDPLYPFSSRYNGAQFPGGMWTTEPRRVAHGRLQRKQERDMQMGALSFWALDDSVLRNFRCLLFPLSEFPSFTAPRTLSLAFEEHMARPVTPIGDLTTGFYLTFDDRVQACSVEHSGDWSQAGLSTRTSCVRLVYVNRSERRFGLIDPFSLTKGQCNSAVALNRMQQLLLSPRHLWLNLPLLLADTEYTQMASWEVEKLIQTMCHESRPSQHQNKRELMCYSRFGVGYDRTTGTCDFSGVSTPSRASSSIHAMKPMLTPEGKVVVLFKDPSFTYEDNNGNQVTNPPIEQQSASTGVGTSLEIHSDVLAVEIPFGCAKNINIETDFVLDSLRMAAPNSHEAAYIMDALCSGSVDCPPLQTIGAGGVCTNRTERNCSGRVEVDGKSYKLIYDSRARRCTAVPPGNINMLRSEDGKFAVFIRAVESNPDRMCEPSEGTYARGSAGTTGYALKMEIDPMHCRNLMFHPDNVNIGLLDTQAFNAIQSVTQSDPRTLTLGKWDGVARVCTDSEEVTYGDLAREAYLFTCGNDISEPLDTVPVWAERAFQESERQFQRRQLTEYASIEHALGMEDFKPRQVDPANDVSTILDNEDAPPLDPSLGAPGSPPPVATRPSQVDDGCFSVSGFLQGVTFDPDSQACVTQKAFDSVPADALGLGIVAAGVALMTLNKSK